MSFAHSQKGLSILGWMTMLALVAFLASAVFKMVPHYLDYSALQKAISSVETDKAAQVQTVPEFYSHISKSMTVNGIRDLKLALSNRVLNRHDGSFQAQRFFDKIKGT